MEHPYSLTLADGQPVKTGNEQITKETAPIHLAIGIYQEILTLDCVSIKYDIILG